MVLSVRVVAEIAVGSREQVEGRLRLYRAGSGLRCAMSNALFRRFRDGDNACLNQGDYFSSTDQ